jgi:hypothetical protein
MAKAKQRNAFRKPKNQKVPTAPPSPFRPQQLPARST